MQKQDFFSYSERQVGRVDIGVSTRPDLRKLDSLIPLKVDDGRVEQVRAKLTYDQRRNAHIAVFGSDFIRWL